MAIQPIRLFGDPVLRSKALEVVDFDQELPVVFKKYVFGITYEQDVPATVAKKLRDAATSTQGQDSVRWSYHALYAATGSLLDFAAIEQTAPHVELPAPHVERASLNDAPTVESRLNSTMQRKATLHAAQDAAAVPSAPSPSAASAAVPGDVTVVVLGQLMRGDSNTAAHPTAVTTSTSTTSADESGPSTATQRTGIDMRSIDVTTDSADADSAKVDSDAAADANDGAPADANAARAAVTAAAPAAPPTAAVTEPSWLTARGSPPLQPAGLFSPGVCTLLDRLHEASTNFERSELVANELYRTPELSCAEVSAIASTFTFASRRRALLVTLYPKLPPDERPGFVDVLEAVLDFDFDRKDVMRDLKLG